jgi:hypothetical protein
LFDECRRSAIRPIATYIGRSTMSAQRPIGDIRSLAMSNGSSPASRRPDPSIRRQVLTTRALTNAGHCSSFVLMQVETLVVKSNERVRRKVKHFGGLRGGSRVPNVRFYPLGAAKSLGWKVHMRCDGGYREETRSMRRCVFRGQLHLETLVATRGPNFPLSRLE